MNKEETEPKDYKFNVDTHHFEQFTPLLLGDVWASGTFGKVHIVDTPSGRIAVKSVPQLEGHVNRELNTCIQLASKNHPNIVKLFGYWTDKSVLYIIMDFMPETLRSLLNNLENEKMRMKIDRMNHLMFQLACALKYLEEIQLMHRDLKPDNILLNANLNQLVLADFGSAKFIEKDTSNITYVCTRFYRAPCLILNCDMYSTSVDIWSFGCILAEFAYGRPLFTGDTQIDVMARIIRILGMITIDDIKDMPTSLPEAINMVDVGVRYTKKPWCKVFTRNLQGKRINASYGDRYEMILDNCLQWNPTKRISAANLCKDPYWGGGGGVSARIKFYN
jgi:serine/threonine protein kinase